MKQTHSKTGTHRSTADNDRLEKDWPDEDWEDSEPATKIAGDNTPSAFDGLPFPTRPTYNGNPWFLPLVGGFYKTMDRLDRACS